MLQRTLCGKRLSLACLLCCFFGGNWPALGQSTNANNAILLEIENSVEVLRAGATTWDPARPAQELFPGDRLRTGTKSRAAIRLSSQTVVRLGELGILQIPDPTPQRAVKLNLFRGIFYFFHRDRPDEFELQTPTVAAVIRGTDFNVEIAPDGKTTLALLDGRIQLTNSHGAVEIQTGDIATVQEGQAPVKTATLTGINSVQWCLYYPAILDLEEIRFSAAETESLRESLSAYRAGDLLSALARYPTNRTNISAEENTYLVALSLSVGHVARLREIQGSTRSAPGESRENLNEALTRVTSALQKVIAAVARQEFTSQGDPELATEWMAESYYQQSRANLARALDAADNATKVSPNFGFAWARLAELQFSFGKTSDAKESLRRALRLTPRNAQAIALEGFILAAQNENFAAMARFDEAIAIDGALGNAWLGRGLNQILRGNIRKGLEDLQVAAALEPQRALLRSYLAKGFSEAWDNERARKEIELAKTLDPGDPTGWLYSALIKQQENQVNSAVRDLENSKALNGNRAVYRSQLLLDQDQSVRSANLASIYADAGMLDVGFREAGKAVALDYANYSAHLFLANSYSALRDPALIDLRYETANVSEYLIANLLAPPGAGLLSRTISQQEYSRFFERDRLRAVSATEYLSDGSWIQDGALFGRFGNTGFSIESAYRSENGQGRNDDFEHIRWSAAIKQQLTAKDSIYLQAALSDFESGDLTHHYDPDSGNDSLRIHEEQEPILLAGYHREWSLNSHTLFLASRLANDYRAKNLAQPVLLLGRDAANEVVVTAKPNPPTSTLDYESDTEIYSTELQQIFQTERHGLVAGLRFQTGDFDTRSQLGASTPTFVGNETSTAPVRFATPALSQSSASDFQRMNTYVYYNWQTFDSLLLTAGVSYDRLHFPENFRIPPLADSEAREDQFSPKVGVIWTPNERATVRGSYARSLGGVSFDQSFRLEPSQVGGFNQAFRSIAPESVVGTLSGASFDTAGIGVDYRFHSGTYLGLEGQWLRSDAERTVGTFDLASGFPFTITPSGVRQELEYQERALVANINQLLGEGWSVGLRYALVDAELENRFPQIPTSVSSAADSTEQALLHQASIYAIFNHASGFFGSVDALWICQDTIAGPAEYQDEEFWHLNAWMGWRFAQRRAELALGLLNMADQDYRLNPLTAMRQLVRDRTFSARVRFAF